MRECGVFVSGMNIGCWVERGGILPCGLLPDRAEGGTGRCDGRWRIRIFSETRKGGDEVCGQEHGGASGVSEPGCDRRLMVVLFTCGCGWWY